MLFWEYENPEYWPVHHLMVASYHIQHPSLYSQEGLDSAKKLLVAFLVEDSSPDEIRQRNRAQVDSNCRTWKIKGTLNKHSFHPHPITWAMTAADVVTDGSDNYCVNVRQWAEAIHETLQAARKSKYPG